MSPLETLLLLSSFCKLLSYIPVTYACTVTVFRILSAQSKNFINEEVLDMVNVMSRMDCLRECSRRPECGGYSFHDTNGICHIKSFMASNSSEQNMTESHVATFRKIGKSCGQPTTKHGLVFNITSTQFEAVYECAVGYNATGGNGSSSCLGNAIWEEPTLVCEAVDCGAPPEINGTEVEFLLGTTYQSTVTYKCALGYIPKDIRASSTCNSTGTWTSTFLECTGIPYLTGTKTLGPSSDSALTCRNVLSEPVNRGGSVDTYCHDDEIVTGCSALNRNQSMQTGGSWLQETNCHAGYVSGTQSVARCCKIPGLQCEYTRSAVSCYENFQLLDCACLGTDGCSTTMTNNTCLTELTGHSFIAYRSAICCSHENLSCYVREVSGDGSVGELTITCGLGETMTACSGFNTDYNVQSALVEDRDGVDTCVIDPGEGCMSTLKGYVSCCKYK